MRVRAILFALVLIIVAAAFVERDALGQPREAAVVNAASFTRPVAPASIASAFGDGFTYETMLAPSLPLPTVLAGVRVEIDGRLAPLFFVSPGQINFYIPADISPGLHKVYISNREGDLFWDDLSVVDSFPAVFTLQRTGQGRAESYSILSEDGQTRYLVFFGTGFRNARPANCVLQLLGAGAFPAVYAGPVPGFVGLDQINVAVPASLPVRDAGAFFQVGVRRSNTFLVNP